MGIRELSQGEVASGIENIIKAAMARGGWNKKPQAEDIQQTAILMAWEIYIRKRPDAPLAYFRSAAFNIITNAAKETGDLVSEEIQEGVKQGAEDLRSEAITALEEKIAETEIYLDDVRKVLRQGNRLLKDLRRIKNSI